MIKTGWSKSPLRVCLRAVYFDESVRTVRDAPTHRRGPLMVLKRTCSHIYVMERRIQPQDVRFSLLEPRSESGSRERRETSVYFRKYKNCFSVGTRPRNLEGGKGARTVFSYGALASHIRRRQSSFSHFYSITLYNKFIHPLTTPQSPKGLILSMKTLLKTRCNGMAYVQSIKNDEGLEKKPQSKQNINPVGFPPIPLSMMWRVDCFLVLG